jgi:hypothetical protein
MIHTSRLILIGKKARGHNAKGRRRRGIRRKCGQMARHDFSF